MSLAIRTKANVELLWNLGIYRLQTASSVGRPDGKVDGARHEIAGFQMLAVAGNN